VVWWGLAFIGIGTLGAWCAFFPRAAFQFFEGWKFKDPESVELEGFVPVWRVFVSSAVAVGCYAYGIWALFLG
jgi:hypothetical protein